MDVLMITGSSDKFLSEKQVDWLVQEPQEMTSQWIPKDYGINEELI
ncbi:hypothetical protein ONE56_05505 [Vibrio mytili]